MTRSVEAKRRIFYLTAFQDEVGKPEWRETFTGMGEMLCGYRKEELVDGDWATYYLALELQYAQMATQIQQVEGVVWERVFKSREELLVDVQGVYGNL